MNTTPLPAPPRLPQLDAAGPSDAAFRLTLALVALCGACDGLAQGALFGAALPSCTAAALRLLARCTHRAARLGWLAC